jgi:hypothetical protein
MKDSKATHVVLFRKDSGGVTHAVWGHTRDIYMADIDGYLIGLVEKYAQEGDDEALVVPLNNARTVVPISTWRFHG